MRHRGFTLIEILIVVAILGALASLSFGGYQRYVARAQLAEGFSLTGGVRTYVAESLTAGGAIPTAIDTSSLVGKYVSSVAYSAQLTMSGVVHVARIQANFGPDAHPLLRGGFLAIVGGPAGSVDVASDGTWSMYGNQATLYGNTSWEWYCTGDGLHVTIDMIRNACK
jgi:prepilin-type N-terminal cleavage/methylation domain-containing protein